MPPTICVEVVYHNEYSAKGNRRGRNRSITFKNIHVYGDKMPRAKFLGYDAAHKTENVLVSNLYFNEEPLAELPQECFDVGAFAENIRLEIDPYAQMAKNTVQAQGQLAQSRYIKFDFPQARGIRVMLVGNSITLHGIRPEIGWYNEWGMAASAKEKDYVHLLEASIRAHAPKPPFASVRQPHGR